MSPFLYLLAFVVAAFIGHKAGGHLKLWLRDRENRIAALWRRRIERSLEDVREMYADQRERAEAEYRRDCDLYRQHGRRREPTPDLLAELHRRQEAARRVTKDAA